MFLAGVVIVPSPCAPKSRREGDFPDKWLGVRVYNFSACRCPDRGVLAALLIGRTGRGAGAGFLCIVLGYSGRCLTLEAHNLLASKRSSWNTYSIRRE